MTRFTHKVVIVTGAGTGIGAATAWRFGAEGASVVLAGRRRAKLEEVASAIDPARVLVQPADMADRESVTALVAAAASRFGGLDVLVNNAATASFGPFETMTLETWQAAMHTNLDGVFYACQAAMPHLLARGGSIVNVSSVSGLGGDWGGSAYNASKGGVSNLTRALALEFGARGVRVNAVNPSFTITEMTESMQDDAVLMAKFTARIALGRPARAAEIASVIAFLASADASFVNGVNLPVDGGCTASNGQPNMG